MNDNRTENQDPESPPPQEVGDQPPDYEQVTMGQDGPPPSYESMFGRIKDARENSSGVCDFFQKVFSLILSTIGCAITLGISLFLPGASILIGALYKDDCPAEPMIPIFLIVSGVAGGLNVLLSLFERQRLKSEDPNTPLSTPAQSLKTRLDCTLIILKAFSLVWFIAGTVWVYRTKSVTSSYAENYCHKIVYDFAFWFITLSYVIVAFWGLCSCCLCVIYAAKGDKK